MAIECRVVTLAQSGQILEVLAVGNLALLQNSKRFGLLRSRKIPGAEFLKCIEWAEEFPVGEATLITGCHSPVELEVAQIVRQRGGQVIIILARAPLKRTPAMLQAYHAGGQIAFVTLKRWTNLRPTRERCLERNSLIKAVAEVVPVD